MSDIIVICDNHQGSVADNHQENVLSENLGGVSQSVQPGPAWTGPGAGGGCSLVTVPVSGPLQLQLQLQPGLASETSVHLSQPGTTHYYLTPPPPYCQSVSQSNTAPDISGQSLSETKSQHQVINTSASSSTGGKVAT